LSLEFGNLLNASARLISKGGSMSFHTKMAATRQFVLKVRTWDKSEGHIARWNFPIRGGEELRAASRRS